MILRLAIIALYRTIANGLPGTVLLKYFLKNRSINSSYKWTEQTSNANANETIGSRCVWSWRMFFRRRRKNNHDQMLFLYCPNNHLSMRIDRQWMSFGVEYPLIERKEICLLEQQIEVFQCFGEKITLHLVTSLNVIFVSYIMNRRVAIYLPSVVFERLKDVPTPVNIDFISRQMIHVVQRFDQFRT